MKNVFKELEKLGEFAFAKELQVVLTTPKKFKIKLGDISDPKKSIFCRIPKSKVVTAPNNWLAAKKFFDKLDRFNVSISSSEGGKYRLYKVILKPVLDSIVEVDKEGNEIHPW